MDEQYWRDEVDFKRVALFVVNKIKIVVLGIVLGACVFALLYFLKTSVFVGNPTFEAVSKLYLTFGVDESGEVYQHYNGYTWNDLMSTDPILDKTMAALTMDIPRQEVVADTKAEILSDIRLLTITITSDSAEKTEAIELATNQALEQFGKEQEELVKIETIETGAVKQVYADNRLVNAAITGAVCGLLVSILGLWLYLILEDSIYVEQDCRRHFNLSCIGMLSGDGEQQTKQLDDELSANCIYKLQDKKNVAVVDLYSTSQADKAVIELRAVLKDQMADQELEIHSFGLDQDIADVFDTLRKMDLVWVLMEQGKPNGKKMRHFMELCKIQDCRIDGIIVTEVRGKYLKRYYK